MAASRLWTVEQKREIIAEYELTPHGSKGLVLRRYGISANQLRDWRAARDAGILEVGGSVRMVVATPRAESADIARLRRENARLEADLARARKDTDDRQEALETLGKATALLHGLVSPKSADPSSPPEPSTGHK